MFKAEEEVKAGRSEPISVNATRNCKFGIESSNLGRRLNGTLLSSTVGFGAVEELLPRLRYGIDLYDQSASPVLRYGIDQVFTYYIYIHDTCFFSPS